VAYSDNKDQREQLVNLSKSVEELLHIQFVNEVFKKSEDGNRLLCQYCHDGNRPKDGLTLPTSNADNQGHQTRRFLNLKHAVTAHLNSKGHQLKSNAATDDRKWTAHASNRNTQAQINIGRLYYVGIKHQDSYRSTEDRIATAKAMGAEVGEVHHSRHHAADFVTTAYDVMLESVKDYYEVTSKRLGFSLPFGVTADKDTSKHRSRQVRTGGIYCISSKSNST
jgi:hypothetical protein